MGAILTVQEVAERMRCEHRTVRRAIRSGELEAALIAVASGSSGRRPSTPGSDLAAPGRIRSLSLRVPGRRVPAPGDPTPPASVERLQAMEGRGG
jgi:excisionase family DNA binding protein